MTNLPDLLDKPTDFFYLATPYTKYKDGIDAAAEVAAWAAAQLINTGVNVFSPIVHSHYMCGIGNGLDPYDISTWYRADLPFLDKAAGLIVYMIDGWRESAGVTMEIEYFKKTRKPIFYINPNAKPVFMETPQ